VEFRVEDAIFSGSVSQPRAHLLLPSFPQLACAWLSRLRTQRLAKHKSSVNSRRLSIVTQCTG
jgi:hypothetical protein